MAFPWMRAKKTVPVILSPDEVVILLNSVKSLKYRTILTVIYSTGLRIGEVRRLTAGDIDSQRVTLGFSDWNKITRGWDRLEWKYLP